MENKLVNINLGLIEPKFIMAVWEYSNLAPVKYPTLFTYTPREAAIKISGFEPMSKRVRIENLPSDLKMVRIKTQRESSFIVDPNLLVFQLHYPDTKAFRSLLRAAKAATYKVLKIHGVPLTERSNDIFFLKDGLEKKFYGTMDRLTAKGWKVAIFSITFNFNSKLANKIYRFDHKTFTKKGEIADISKIVGGICEVVPNINRDEVAKNVIQKIGERYNLKVNEEKLTKSKLLKMNDFVNNFDNKNWYLYGREN